MEKGWGGGKKKKLEWSVFSQVSGSQVAPTLTGSESGQVQLLSRCCARGGTCPEPGSGSGSQAGTGVQDLFRPEISFQVPVLETDPGGWPGLLLPTRLGGGGGWGGVRKGGGREVACRERTVGDRGGEFPASGPRGELQASGGE